MAQDKKPERARELEALIRTYSASYYNGEAEISDKEFDDLWDELKKIDPANPVLAEVGGDSTDGFPKAEHIIPMGSQDKAANPGEFLAWAEKIHPSAYVVQYKLDGASLELQYLDGNLSKAVTRGKNKTGDDITANAKRMNGVVSKLDIPFNGGIRGEVIMTHEVWGEKYRDKANCRNAANGIMRRKDGSAVTTRRIQMMIITLPMKSKKLSGLRAAVLPQPAQRNSIIPKTSSSTAKQFRKSERNFLLILTVLLLRINKSTWMIFARTAPNGRSRLSLNLKPRSVC